MRTAPLLLTLFLSLTLGGRAQNMAPPELPAAATTALRDSLEEARAYHHHVWRDTSPVNGDGSVTEVRRLCRRLSDTWPRPLIVKLPYSLSNTLALIDVAIGSGADAISIGGGFPAAVVDRTHHRDVVGNLLAWAVASGLPPHAGTGSPLS